MLNTANNHFHLFLLQLYSSSRFHLNGIKRKICWFKFGFSILKVLKKNKNQKHFTQMAQTHRTTLLSVTVISIGMRGSMWGCITWPWENDCSNAASHSQSVCWHTCVSIQSWPPLCCWWHEEYLCALVSKKKPQNKTADWSFKCTCCTSTSKSLIHNCVNLKQGSKFQRTSWRSTKKLLEILSIPKKWL